MRDNQPREERLSLLTKKRFETHWELALQTALTLAACTKT
jgi:hypothetical protein